mmetsp:Transcript_19305/g.62963  ORF Transcript_19305/g.62963 Transcript_19305/m.62963 type:complete len:209 (-) Transcript_19305:406-1032(-)
MTGGFHSPQPAALHFGFGTIGGSHSPSSSSSQSAGALAVASGTWSGSSSSHAAGFTALGSLIRTGASLSQLSGLTASGSTILGASTQSAGLMSSGSSTSFGGLIASRKSVSDSRSAVFFSSPSTRMRTLLSGLKMAVYRCGFRSWTGGMKGDVMWHSFHVPSVGLLWRRMKCSLWLEPQRSGPNMMVYGVSPLKVSDERPSSAAKSFR